MSKMSSIRRCLMVTTCAVLVSGSAQANEVDTDDLLNLSLEQLTNMEVTSVSKKSEKATEAAAAVFVITSDDIRRMGVTSIPEALRIVPGLNVAQSSSHQWAVTARGFNDQFANKLLVMIDGRTIYTPLFNGVWWDAQDTLLEDIDRIEVIRGPGATLWGANAVNGVINIITKESKDTVGSFASFTSGDIVNSIASARHGAKVGDESYMRAYVKYKNIDEFRSLTDTGANDQWHNSQGGFRGDYTLDDRNSLTVQGDAYSANINYVLSQPSVASPPVITSSETAHLKGANILARWNHVASDTSEYTTQFYYDSASRSNIIYSDIIRTVDLDFQHTWTELASHEVVWGGGYRYVEHDLDPTILYFLSPSERRDNLFSAFIQDKVTLLPDTLYLTLGSKFEVNDYTGFEYQPNARLSWLIGEGHTFWASVTRAVKTPYRGTDDGGLALAAFPVAAPVGLLGSAGNSDLESERLVAYEAGYRIQPVDTVSLDVATFYNDYSNLIRGLLGTTTTRQLPGGAPVFYFPIIPYNDNEARSYGVEVTGNWDVMDNWQLSASYSWLDLKFDKADSLGFPLAGKSPEQQFNVRSTVLLPYDLELNNQVYYVDSLPGINVPDYVRFDARLGWKPLDGVELSIVGQNLFDPEHQEFGGFIYQSACQVPRSLFGNITFRF